MRLFVVFLFIALAGCKPPFHIDDQKTTVEISRTPEKYPDTNCHTEPNGEAIRYPTTTPFYADGSQLTFNGTPMICLAGKWGFDERMWALDREADKPRRDLLEALNTRLLSKKELLEVNQYGSYLLVEPNSTFNQNDINAKFAALLKVQELMRLAASSENTK